jgi:hypothetical protein
MCQEEEQTMNFQTMKHNDFGTENTILWPWWRNSDEEMLNQWWADDIYEPGME